MLVPLGMVPAARAAIRGHAARKNASFGAVIAETLPASRLPEVYADIRPRAARSLSAEHAATPPRMARPASPTSTPTSCANIGKIISLLHYSLRAADEAEPFLASHRDEMIADFAQPQAKYLTLPEIQALGELLNLPAIRKAFNALYAGSRLFTDYSYQELRSYYEMTAWFRDLNINARTIRSPSRTPRRRRPSWSPRRKASSPISCASRGWTKWSSG